MMKDNKMKDEQMGVIMLYYPFISHLFIFHHGSIPCK